MADKDKLKSIDPSGIHKAGTALKDASQTIIFMNLVVILYVIFKPDSAIGNIIWGIVVLIFWIGIVLSIRQAGEHLQGAVEKEVSE